MSRCIEKIKHSCGHFSLQVFQQDNGTFDGYCFFCGKHEPNPYGDMPPDYKPKLVLKSPEQIQAELEEIGDYQVIDLPQRKLKKESLDYFGVKIGVSEEDGLTPSSTYFPYYQGDTLIGYKARILDPKTMWAVGTTKGADLFGWQQALNTGAKKLFITEGEFDAVALYQIFKEQSRGTAYADFNPAIVSLVHGAGHAKRDIPAKLKDIHQHFKEVILVFDSDEAGKKAADEVAKLVPEVMIAVLPSKDANEALIQGRSKAAHSACQFNAKAPKNTRLVNGNDLHEQAKVPPVYGFSWPWKHITKATRGLRFGETIYIGAGQKQGKSEVVNTLAAHFIREHGIKVFLVKPEESNNKTYKLVAGKLTGKFFHDPDKPFDEDAYEEAGKTLKDHLFMLNLYQHVGWESLKTDIRHAAVVEGCRVIMIDPITNLTNGMDAATANVKLQEIAQELSAMALDLNVLIFIFCHLRNPDAGPPHERGGEVLSSQFAGSRAMARSCNLMLGIEGNRDPNHSAEERNIRTLVLLEDREHGEVGRFKLYWDNNTGLFNEIN
jgi:twinkle protein